MKLKTHWKICLKSKDLSWTKIVIMKFTKNNGHHGLTSLFEMYLIITICFKFQVLLFHAIYLCIFLIN